MAHSFLDHELNEDFEKLCMDLKESAETLGLQQLPFYLPATITNRQPVGQVHSHSSSEECSSELVRRSLRQKGMGPLSEGLPYYEKKRASSKKTTSEQEEMATEEEQEDEQSKSNQEKADTGEAMEISEENPYNNEDEPGEKDTNLKEKYYSPQMVTRAAKKRLSANSESEKDSLVVQLPKSAIKSVPAPHSINHASDSHDSYGNDKTVRKEEESGVHNFHLCLSDDVQESDTIAEDNAFLSDETDTARQQTDSRELATQSSLKNDGDISQVTPPAYVDNMEGSPLQATEPKQVLISRNDQFKLLNRIVRRTECANLQTLQKLHSMLRHVVFRYRMTAERYQLTKVNKCNSYEAFPIVFSKPPLLAHFLQPHTTSYNLTLRPTASHYLLQSHTTSYNLTLRPTASHYLLQPHTTSYNLTLPPTISHYILQPHTTSYSLTLLPTASHYFLQPHTLPTASHYFLQPPTTFYSLTHFLQPHYA